MIFQDSLNYDSVGLGMISKKLSIHDYMDVLGMISTELLIHDYMDWVIICTLSLHPWRISVCDNLSFLFSPQKKMVAAFFDN